MTWTSTRTARPALLIIAFLCSGSIATAAGPITRDWTKYPAVVQIDRQPERLFAVGDVHGDYRRLLALLRREHLIGPHPRRPQDAKWTGGNAVLVQTGDLIDKGPHPVDVIRFLAALRASASREGGQVIVTMGNHEAEFMAGPNGTKAKDFLLDLKKKNIRVEDIQHCTGDIGEFFCTLPVAAKVGDWFFSHGGNPAGRTVEQIASAVTKAVSKDGFGADELANASSILEARLGEGKVWFHPSDKDPDSKKTERDVLAADTAALGVAHLAQGHVPSEVVFADGVIRHKGEMFQRWGLIFLTDTGMSRAVGDSKGAILRITAAGAIAVCPGGLETKLWDDSAKPDQGRAVPCLK